MKKIRISAVIPTYGRNDTLSKTIESLFRQNIQKSSYEIIVVYSKTDREILQKLAKKSPCRFRFFEEKEVRISGAAASRNYAVSVAAGELIAFIDDDCVAHNDWLQKGWKYYQKHKRYAGFMGTTVTDKKKVTITSRYMHRVKPEKVATCPTCNVFFRRDVFMKYKYPVYKHYAGISHRADTDLAFTMIEHGHKIGFSNATVYHPVYPAPSMKWYVNQGRYREVEPMFYKRHPALYWKSPPYFVSRATLSMWLLFALSLTVLFAYNLLYAAGFFLLGYSGILLYVLLSRRKLFALKSLDTVKFILVLPIRTIIEFVFLIKGMIVHWVIERKENGLK